MVYKTLALLLLVAVLLVCIIGYTISRKQIRYRSVGIFLHMRKRYVDS